MNRYTVNAIPGPDEGYWFIYDRELFAECGLPVNEHNPSATVPLRWKYRGDIHGEDAHLSWDAAHRWLANCVAQWGAVPRIGREHPADVDWQAVQDALSAAARGQMNREAAAHEHIV